MGIYNTYEGVQIKVGNCLMDEYKIGDKVDLPNGVYVGFEGIIVIIDNILKAKFSFILDKWGSIIEPKEIIEDNNPVKQAIDNIKKTKGLDDFIDLYKKLDRMTLLKIFMSLNAPLKKVVKECMEEGKMEVEEAIETSLNALAISEYYKMHPEISMGS